MIDREHVSDFEQLRRKLGMYGFEILEHEPLHENCWRIRVWKYSKEAVVYVVIFGFKKCVEEHLAVLINLLHGKQVKPEKEVVNNWLKRHKIEDVDLVREALKRQVFDKAFPQLAIALRELARSL